MENLHEEIIVHLCSFVDNEPLWNLINASKRLAQCIASSRSLMLRYKLDVTPEKFVVLSSPGGELSKIPFRNIQITSFKGADQLRKFSKILKICKTYVEIFEVVDFKRNSIRDTLDFFNGVTNLTSLTLRNCNINEEVHNQILKPIKNLKEIYFEKCDGNLFKIFRRQTSITKITVRNTDWTWNGFVHEDFNHLAKTLPNLYLIVMDGTGTGSYFDCDSFPYKIKKLIKTLITFHWYVGIRTARKNFLESQKGTLSELTIFNLPYDFDGGRVLKFIIEEMGLRKFYYGKIPLIIDGIKQHVTGFSATEIQICSTFEMFRQFSTIICFELVLNSTDVDSSEIERVVDPQTDLFDDVKQLEILDKSGYRRILGVFLGLFKNFRNITSLKLRSLDRNINVLLQEFLPLMSDLAEIYIDSNASRVGDRFNTIRTNVIGLRKLWVDAEYVDQARTFFGESVEVYETEIYNY